MLLPEYIAKHWGTHRGAQVEFARAQGVQKQQVTQWINKGAMVFDHRLYLPKRELVLKSA